jgi:hypothetical protein
MYGWIYTNTKYPSTTLTAGSVFFAQLIEKAADDFSQHFARSLLRQRYPGVESIIVHATIGLVHLETHRNRVVEIASSSCHGQIVGTRRGAWRGRGE